LELAVALAGCVIFKGKCDACVVSDVWEEAMISMQEKA